MVIPRDCAARDHLADLAYKPAPSALRSPEQ